jgi:outer membrane protein OmpA-like peptidoglycan-associated protein
MVALAFAVAGTSACASKGFVRSEVGTVSGKVDSLSQSLEQTQERTRLNEENITKVDGKATAAQTTADAAQQAATAADTKAGTAGDAARAAAAKVDAVEKDMKRITATVVLSEDQGGFVISKAILPAEAMAKIDEMVTGLKADPKGSFFEIEGHTDNTGDKMFNEKLGLERANAVKRYLYEQHQVPLHKINVISYGEDKPAGDNGTKEGRAQNRRVVIKVLN